MISNLLWEKKHCTVPRAQPGNSTLSNYKHYTACQIVVLPNKSWVQHDSMFNNFLCLVFHIHNVTLYGPIVILYLSFRASQVYNI